MVRAGQFRRSSSVPNLFFHVIKVYLSPVVEEQEAEYGFEKLCDLRTTEGVISTRWPINNVENTSTIVE